LVPIEPVSAYGEDLVNVARAQRNVPVMTDRHIRRPRHRLAEIMELLITSI
jgi:hypothetical protein